MTSANNLPRRVAAIEQRMGVGQQPETIFVYRGLTETEDEALARHFEGKGPPPGAEIAWYCLGPMIGRGEAEEAGQ